MTKHFLTGLELDQTNVLNLLKLAKNIKNQPQ
ncbi:ornithine carbamoyltransferase, partial [Pseudoalteromonas sp. S1941]